MKYSKELEKEIQTIIDNTDMTCSIKDFHNVAPWESPIFNGINQFSKTFLRKFQDKINWRLLSLYHNLSEDVIREFQDKVDWYYIANSQTLSENFIRDFKHKMSSREISFYQKLSEDFMRESIDYINFSEIALKQKLSESFIREFHDQLYPYFNRISYSQKLSEEFIERFQNELSWNYISAYQILSENFIRKFSHLVNDRNITRYQKLSPEFRKEFNIKVPKHNWLYATIKTKETHIKRKTSYEIQEDEQGKYILAYKVIRRDNYSAYNFQYKYEVGQEYEAHCDCNLREDNSFGLSAWTLKMAKAYHNRGKIILVKIYLKDIGAIVHDGNKIRCFKFKVMEEIKD